MKGLLPEMKVKQFAPYSIESVFSYQSPAEIVDDFSMPVRNDLSCGTWDSGSNQELNCHGRVWTAEGGCLEMSLTQILVVEDYEPFRRFICSTLTEKSELEIVGEVSDGLKAVQRAKELQPDLILLDIGLPSLNGIEVARRIRKLLPDSKILFLSQESSVDVVQEALGTGAQGYVVKSDAGSELLEGVDAVLRGEPFVGKRFCAQDFIGGSHAGGSQDVPANSTVAQLQQNIEIPRRDVGFYSDDASLLVDLTQFVETALKAGHAAIVVASGPHRSSLLSRLHAHGVDTAAAMEQGRYISVDAAEALSSFMVDHLPDPVRFLNLLRDLIATAAQAAKGGCVAIFGECVHILWAKGNVEAAIQLEKLGNQLTKSYHVEILCGYHLGAVPGGMDSHIFQQICAEHSAFYS